MEFHVSAEQVRRENRRAAYMILIFTLVSFGLIVKLLSVDKISDAVFPIIGLIFFVPLIFGSYKRIKEGKAAYPILEIDDTNPKIAVQHKDLRVIVDLSQIKNLRLQRKSGRLVSVLVKTSSGESLRFDGYENLDALASALERLTPKGCITNASFFHR